MNNNHVYINAAASRKAIAPAAVIARNANVSYVKTITESTVSDPLICPITGA